MHGVFAATEPILVPCGPDFSFFFDLIQPAWVGFNNNPLHRICTLMRKMRACCFTREELPMVGELVEERDAAAIRTGHAVGATAQRITFFRTFPDANRWQALGDTDALGYAVILRLNLKGGETRTYILESVICLPAMTVEGVGLTNVSNYYVHCCRDFETTVGTAAAHKNFKITGAFFCQQNDLTHVCAHAALRMAVNSTVTGAKLTNLAINAVLGIDHTAVKVGRYGTEKGPSGGLDANQISRVANNLGWNTAVADFAANPAVDYQEFAYPLLESGYPVILGIAAPRVAHVVAILGHTLNTDRWTPEARYGYAGLPVSPYISTASWVDHFIVSDDNFGMYVTLPTDAVRNILVPKYNPNLHASLAIGLVPLGVTIAGDLVERSTAALAVKLIRLITPTADNRWLLFLKDVLADTNLAKPHHWLVCRTLMRDKATFNAAMTTGADEKGNKLDAGELAFLDSLPDRFWVTEITVPNLYTGNKHKLGDIITKADPTEAEFVSGAMTLFAWLPGVCWKGAGLVNAAETWSIRGHIPLLRSSKNDSRSVEW